MSRCPYHPAAAGAAAAHVRPAETGVAGDVFTGLGAAVVGGSVSFTSLLAAGFNVVPVGMLVLGIGTLAHGLVPRLADAVAYGIVAWSFLVEITGVGLVTSHWLLDPSVLHHLARSPAANVRWDSVTVTVGLVTAASGALAFACRDLKGT